MENIFIKIKFIKIFFIELILFVLLIISNVIFESMSSIQNILLIIILYFVPTAWIIYELSKYGSSIKELFKPIKCNRNKIAATIAMTFMLSYCLFLSVQLLGNIFNSPVVYNVKEFSIMHILTIVIIAPVAEEIFFRGYLLNKLMTKGNIKKAIILSSVLFGIMHFINCINAFIIGLCFALIYVKYRNLFLTMIIHSLYNGMLILYKFLIYINAFTISTQIAPFLLVITMSLVIVGILWIIHFIRCNSYILKKNNDI